MNGSLTRQQIRDRVETWLETALGPEAGVEGIDPEVLAEVLNGEGVGQEREYDAASAWATITALTHEVKLQGRAFKELAEALNSQQGRAAEEMRGAYREREKEMQREVERRCRREILGGLLDLRDSLERGRKSALAVEAKPVATGWRARLAGPVPDATGGIRAALRKGYDLTLERLDQMLSEWNVRPLAVEGKTFDPARMNAIEVEETDGATDGTVLEVYRAGYEWGDEVFRAAQVRVARARRQERNDV